MAYITQTNIEDLAGTDNVAIWSNLDNSTTTADAARVAKAIAWAESTAHTRLRDRFVIPLTPVTGTMAADAADVIDVLAKLAASWLYSSRRAREGDATDIPGGWRKEAEEIMDLWNGGSRQVNLVRRSGRRTSVAVAV